MTHLEWIKKEFNVIAEKPNGILFEAYGEVVAEINGQPFNIETVEEFNDYCEFFGDETFEV